MRTRRSGAGSTISPTRVDVALHEVAAEPVGQPHRALEVHRIARPRVAEVGAGEGLVDDVGLAPAVADATTVRQQPLTAIESPSAASSSN